MSTSTEHDPVADEVLAFLRERTGDDWAVDRDLFAEGGLSSMFAMELVVYLETRFDIAVEGSDLQMSNFRTVASMTQLVVRLRRGESDPAAWSR